jgi:hypothetical protein
VSYNQADDSAPTDESLGDTNGAGSLGAGIAPHNGVFVIIGGSVAFLFLMGWVFRKKSKAGISASISS